MNQKEIIEINGMEDLITQKEIDEINEGIPFVDTKIYWKENYGWTSQYWDKLYKMGWRMVQSKKDPKIVIAQDENGNFCFSAQDRIDLLKTLVHYFIGGG
ncbi:hypothetical protein [Pelotomaculum propionicicum]|uniref:Uncharacterized protein n=1 Tax=Pelotomaculum propionicicum TaxID=258475 RepID=A0A4Y7RTU7_9FIRM|nr:hypothetical protein [Pelotomaculum propionicicum]NLI14077.1 hypothetical protein [Peptococcaceae bacterium]TEB11667.1 hypothetical protein Pmgp_01463 [Pelotomaculum propionicicum]